MDNKRLMDFTIFTNLDKFIEEIEGLKQLKALRVDSPSLAAAHGYNKNHRPPGFQNLDTKEKGKSTYQSYRDGDKNAPPRCCSMP